MDNNTRQDYLFKATIAKEAKRFNDAMQNIQKIVEEYGNLTKQEQKILQTVHINIMTLFEKQLKVYSYLLIKEEKKKSNKIDLLRNHMQKWLGQFETFCNEFIHMIDFLLIPKAENAEAQTFFFKIKGDHYSKLYEMFSDSMDQQIIKKTQEAYKAAMEAAEKIVGITPVLLSLGLNYGEFLNKIQNWTYNSYWILKNIQRKVYADLDEINEDTLAELIPLMNIVKYKLVDWGSYGQITEDMLEKLK